MQADSKARLTAQGAELTGLRDLKPTRESIDQVETSKCLNIRPAAPIEISIGAAFVVYRQPFMADDKLCLMWIPQRLPRPAPRRPAEPCAVLPRVLLLMPPLFRLPFCVDRPDT
jgi:hypothetical protein